MPDSVPSTERHSAPGSAAAHAASPAYVPGPNVVEWALAEDRRSLKVVTREDAGFRHITLRWDHDPTDADIQRALEPPLLPSMLPGERRCGRRWVLGKRTVWFHTMSGPPTWWWPRCFIHQGALIVGWLRRAIAFAVKPTGSVT